MPGAFTPTCSSEHLPGYVKAAPKLAESGIDTVAILTTNDRYVNEEWGTKQGALASSSLVVLCDGDGDFVKAMGLAEDMGFGVGVRSKRFVLLLDEGVVEKVLVDEGMEDCSATSAEAVLQLLNPDVVEEQEGAGAQMGVLASVAAAVVFFATNTGGGFMPALDPIPTNEAQVRQEKQAPAPPFQKASTKSSGFSLLDEFKP